MESAPGPNIHVADLKTSQVSDLPGSEDLFSPRCSPDGRYVAALSGDSTRLMLYDREKKTLDAAGLVTLRFRKLVTRWKVSLCRGLFRQDRRPGAGECRHRQNGTPVQPEGSSAWLRSLGILGRSGVRRLAAPDAGQKHAGDLQPGCAPARSGAAGVPPAVRWASRPPSGSRLPTNSPSRCAG